MKRHAPRATALLILLIAAWGAVGCIQKARPASPSGFIPDKELEKPSDLPFQKAWRKKDLDWSHYRQIYIAPWNTEHLREMNWWEKLERGEKVREDAKELAGYARAVFEEAFRQDKKHRFTVVDQPGPNVLVAEFALIEVVPNKVVLDALGYAAGPAVGAAGTVAANVQTATTHSTVAFEARMKDGATNDVVAMFADRESEKFSLVNVKDLTWYGHAKAILREWADQFVKITHKQPGEIVKDSAPFDLRPW
jgi:hypothetical protein